MLTKFWGHRVEENESYQCSSREMPSSQSARKPGQGAFTMPLFFLPRERANKTSLFRPS